MLWKGIGQEDSYSTFEGLVFFDLLSSSTKTDSQLAPGLYQVLSSGHQPNLQSHFPLVLPNSTVERSTPFST